MTETPSELLTRAADLIRDRATVATPGPWEIEYNYRGVVPQAVFRMDPDHPTDTDYSTGLGAMDAPEDNRWIALLNPSVAPALEAWLRYEAKQIEGLRSPRAGIALPETRHATAFARAVLGLVDTPEEAK